MLNLFKFDVLETVKYTQITSVKAIKKKQFVLD